MILFPEDLHAGADIARLALPESAGTDDLLDLVHIRFRQRFHIREFFIEILNDHIDSRIRALGRQAHAAQKFPSFVVIQRAVRIRILFF